MSESGRLIAYEGAEPRLDPTAWVAPGATLVGSVALGAEVGVYYGAVLRGDSDSIAVGARSNLQDGVVVHVDTGVPVRVGSGVSVGHRAVLHGCTLEDDCLIGMGAVVLNHAVVGAGSLVAAGAVVLEGTEVPAGSLVAGVPAKVRRPLTDSERAAILANADGYVDRTRRHAAATASPPA